MAYLPSNSSMTPELMKAFQEFLKQQISSSPAPSSRYTAGQLREHPGLKVSGVDPALIPPSIGGRGNRGNAGMNAKRRAVKGGMGPAFRPQLHVDNPKQARNEIPRLSRPVGRRSAPSISNTLAPGGIPEANENRIAQGNMTDSDFQSFAAGGQSGERQAFIGATKPSATYDLADLDAQIEEEKKKMRLRGEL
jgi:hypothetical protein